MTVKPLSILFVGDYPPDPTLGSPKVFYKLQQEFAALGHRCDIMFGPEIGGTAFRQIRQLQSPWRTGNAIVRRLEAHAYDVVDAASAEGLFFGVLKKFGIYKNAAYICRSNGIEHLNYRRMLGDAAAGLVRKPWTRRVWYPVSRLSQVAAAARIADRLLLLNEGDRQYALQQGWQSDDGVDLVPHGLAPEFLASDPGDDAARGKGLLFCGSWDVVKGTPYLVRAFERLTESGAGCTLTVLGPGLPASEVLQAFNPSARQFVHVVDRAGEDAVRRAYCEHDVLLWPSTYEGFGLVLIEAMSQRMAVVATPVGCATTLLRDGVNGVVVPPRDAAALADAAARLAGDPGERRRLGRAAREAVAAMSWRACAEQTIRCYRKALEDRR